MTEETKLLGLDFSVASELLIEILIDDAEEPEIFTDILRANTARPEILRLLLQSPRVSEDIRSEAGKILNLPVRAGAAPGTKSVGVSEEQQRKQSLLQKIRTLTVGEKIALALKGGRDIRSLLAKDSNKEVVFNVLKNPRLTETEAELLAHSRNIPDEALRIISKNREWMKSYGIVAALINNPKTPVGISSTLVGHLKTRDIVTLEKNKNVPEAVRSVAKKFLAVRKPK